MEQGIDQLATVAEQEEEESHPTDVDPPGLNQGDEESLPDYDSISVSPVSYDAGLSADQREPVDLESFTDAAPPSYFHLFPGRTAKGSGGRVPKGRRRRRHTQSRRPRVAALREDVIVGPLRRLYRRMNKTAIGSLAIGLILLLSAIPVAMVVIGFHNLHVCQISAIPIYLIVAGFVLTAELTLHSALCCWDGFSDPENSSRRVTRTMRRCDCFAFFLFVWLLFGSRWVFGIGLTNSGCTVVDDVVIAPPVNVSTMLRSSAVHRSTGNVNLAPASPDLRHYRSEDKRSSVHRREHVTEDTASHTPDSRRYQLEDKRSSVHRREHATESTSSPTADASCQDCGKAVYIFTAVVILLQYILGLALVMFCCSSWLRHRQE